MRGGQYWRKEEERMCRVCRKEKESITHVIRRCEEAKSEITMEEFLNEDGKGWEAMKRLNRIREEKEKEEMDKEENTTSQNIKPKK